ncbi:hypothetical protein LCGC14_0735340 [marine sediment metagenome]|uniref:DNA N-6-adenine-methyltransferase (Dam) n=1 Tax=marine sediment metagenome TaxID=412755 RepID=A0A0F9QCJ4_9ZZZZ
MANKVYMPPSKSVEYPTPDDLFDQLNGEFGPFTLDPCCRPAHYTAKRVLDAGGTIYIPPDVSGEWKDAYEDVKVDGLAQDWHGRVFMNPPYGREIVKWIEKAVEEVYVEERVEIVVALLPVRTDTAWWQGYINRGNSMAPQLGQKLLNIHLANRNIKLPYATASGVRYLPGRLKFGGEKNSAQFASAVVVWSRYDD